LFLGRRRIDFRDGDLFAEDTFMILINVFVRGVYVRAVCNRLHVIEIFGDRFNLRMSWGINEEEKSEKGNQSSHVFPP